MRRRGLRLSQRLEAERDFVQKALGAKIICGRCDATLLTYARRCTADLSETCPGFEAIEAAKDNFRKLEAEK